ncbi:MAG: hypothetical protein ACRC1L_07375 [Prochlorococcaceae cyanobacterium]
MHETVHEKVQWTVQWTATALHAWETRDRLSMLEQGPDRQRAPGLDGITFGPAR